MTPLPFASHRHIVLLTGAGISRASGLRTFRGPDGVWNDDDVARLSAIDGFEADPARGWRFWGQMRAQARQAAPNTAHVAIASFQKRLRPGQRLTLVTQNVDGLHQRAGSNDVRELHGSLLHTRCSDPSCRSHPFEDVATHADGAPPCTVCGAWLRPDIVFFGEPVAPLASHMAKVALRDVDLFVAIGTSGSVDPAASFVRSARYAGARTVLVNLEAPERADSDYDEVVIGKAEDVLGDLLG